jgi:hypothetical protein
MTLSFSNTKFDNKWVLMQQDNLQQLKKAEADFSTADLKTKCNML